MDRNSNQLKKVRTFQSDMARLRGDSAPIGPEPEPKPAAPSVTLPPVLVPAKPVAAKPAPTPIAAVAPAVKTPTAASTPAPIVQAAPPEKFIPPAQPPTAAQVDVSKRLRGVKTSQPASEPERLDIMDSDSAVVVGSIITDQKRERFSLLPAMGEAIRGWFNEGKEAIEDRAEAKRQAVPTVRTIEERKEVVQKAAEQSALAPKDDYKKLQARLPSSLPKQAAADQPVVIKKKDPAKKPAWSHFTGVAEAPKAPPATAPAAAKKPEAPAPLTPSAAPVLAPPPVRAAASPAPKIEPVAITINPAPTRAAAPASPPVRAASTAAAASAGIHLPLAVWYAAILIVAVSAAGGGVWLSMQLFLPPGAPATSENPVAEAPIETPTAVDRSPVAGSALIPLPLSDSKAELFAAIRQSAGSGLSAMTLTQNGRAADTRSVLAVLAWRASPSLLRSIESLTFGTYQSSAFVILKVSSFDTAFGGILAAEDNLPDDLSPLFRADTELTAASSTAVAPSAGSVPLFLDEIVANHDVRVWRGPRGEERIVYGFVNQNTIVIAENRDAFAALAPLVR